MRLQTAPFDAAADLGADWLELKSVCAPDHRLILSDVERMWERNRVSEDEDPIGGVSEFDDWLNARLACVQRRIECLGSAYPFQLERDDRELRFVPLTEKHIGQSVYLLCLLLSTAGETEVFAEKVHITPQMRDLFQACSAWAAAGAVNGCAYAMGWPRPEGTDYLTALQEVFVGLMADGDVEPVGALPPGASGFEKDGGIDVVAWQPRPDNCAGKIHLIGQVASGGNWRDKPVHPDVEQISQMWLLRGWATKPVLGMFIPFSIRPAKPEVTHQQQVRYHSARYGALFYREVLPWYAEKGIRIAKQEKTYCHRRREVRLLRTAERALIPQLIAAQV